MSRLLKLFLLVTMSSCRSPMDDCTLQAPAPGIELHVVDALTGVSLTSSALVTVLRLTPPTQTATGRIGVLGQPSPLDVAHGLPGTYRLIIELSGYATWTSEVEVQRAAGPCGAAITRQVVAQLQRIPPP